MPSRQPKNYLCPFCDWLAGNETDYKRNADIFYQTDLVTAFISPKGLPSNPGNTLIIPNKHYENLYTIPDDLLTAVHAASKSVGVAMRRVYHCDGISVHQHNEPAGGQDIWHFHIHIQPRYRGDRLYQRYDQRVFIKPEVRAAYAKRLASYFVQGQPQNSSDAS